MSLYEVSIKTLQGDDASLADYEGVAVLMVNVASKCGFTPQYEGLQKLQEEYGDRRFSVLGFPCNQFGAQEPGSPDEIAEFCATNYGVSFPIFEKIEVNGDGRHRIFDILTARADADGKAGDVQWNFEKFLVSPGGDVVGRFRTTVDPEADEVVGAIEEVLPA